jgi:hypothetical protein
VVKVVFRLSAVVLHSNEGVPVSEVLMSCLVPNRGIAECPNRARIYVDGVPRGRADTPGFYRQPEILGQQVTEFGVLPLPRKSTQQEARLVEWASCVSWAAPIASWSCRNRKQIILHSDCGHGWFPAHCW